jgi:hypothetical protein
MQTHQPVGPRPHSCVVIISDSPRLQNIFFTRLEALPLPAKVAFKEMCNGLHDRYRRQTIPGNPPTKPIYIRISLRGQFMYLTVSMRLTILGVTCIGAAELNALATDCCRISSLRLTMCCCPTRETLDSRRRFLNRCRAAAVSAHSQVSPPKLTSRPGALSHASADKSKGEFST